MDEVRIAIIIGALLLLIGAGFRGVGWVTARIARIVSDHLIESLRDSLVIAVKTSLTTEIRTHVQEAVDGRFETMELRINEIHQELRDNGGNSLKDVVRRIEARQEKDAERTSAAMTKVWDTFSKLGIERRGSETGDAEGSY